MSRLGFVAGKDKIPKSGKLERQSLLDQAIQVNDIQQQSNRSMDLKEARQIVGELGQIRQAAQKIKVDFPRFRRHPVKYYFVNFNIINWRNSTWVA